MKLFPLLTLALAASALAQTDAPAPASTDYSNVPSIYADRYQVAADASYEQTLEITRVIRDQNDLQNGTVISSQFISSLQSAEAPEAYVIKPDGEKMMVGKEQITVKDAPGAGGYADFGDNKIIQVLFPNVSVGDKIYAKLHIKSQAIFPGRFTYFTENAPLGYPYQATTIITAPSSLKLQGKARGAVKLDQKTVGDQTEFTLTESNDTYKPNEANAECPCDYAGAASINNFEGWADLARAYRDRADDKVSQTPEITALSAKLIGDKTGLDAVKAIDAWVRENVRYVQVYLEAGGYVPHQASDILKNRYGDCKDYVTLTQALLKAANIASEPILVGTMARYQAIPLPGPEQFNHAILYVPALKLYLDPTNRFAPLGAYQDPLAGKPVLHTTSGELAQFPVSQAQANRYEQTSNLTLDIDGTLSGKVEASGSGTISSVMRNAFAGVTSEQQPQVVRNMLDNTNEPGNGTMTLAPDFVEAAGPFLSAEWSSPKLVPMDDVTSLKLPSGVTFYALANLKGVVSPETRLTPEVVGASEIHKRVTLNLPDGLNVLRLPKDAQGDDATFAYKVTYQQQGQQIIADQTLTFKNDIVSPQEYPAFREQLLNAVRATEAPLLLEKK